MPACRRYRGVAVAVGTEMVGAAAGPAAGVAAASAAAPVRDREAGDDAELAHPDGHTMTAGLGSHATVKLFQTGVWCLYGNTMEAA